MAKKELLFVSAQACSALTVAVRGCDRNFVHPPSFCGRAVPFRSGTNRIRLLSEIAASLRAGVRFWSTPGISFSDACGMSYPLVGEATGVGDCDVQPGPSNFLRASSTAAPLRRALYCPS